MQKPTHRPGLLVVVCLLALAAFWPALVQQTRADEKLSDPEPAAETPTDQPTDPPPEEPTDPPPEEPTSEPPTRETVPPDETDTPPDPGNGGGGGGGGGSGTNPDLVLVKTVDNTVPTIGDQIMFTVTVTHAEGSEQAENVVITDTLPPFLSLVTATTSWGTLTTSGNTVTVNIDQLFPDDIVTVNIVAEVTASTPAPPDNFNFARVETTSTEKTTDNNEDGADIYVEPEQTPIPTPLPVVEETMTVPETVPPTATPAPTPPALPETSLNTGTSSGVPSTSSEPAVLPPTGESESLPVLPLALAGGALLLGLTLLLVRRRSQE